MSLTIFRLFRVKVHNVFAQSNDVFAENAIIENTDGVLDASRVRRRIFSGSLEGITVFINLILSPANYFLLASCQ